MNPHRVFFLPTISQWRAHGPVKLKAAMVAVAARAAGAAGAPAGVAGVAEVAEERQVSTPERMHLEERATV